MENASKALIMAGAVLIAILLISVGLILVNSGKGVADSGKKAMQTQEIQTFNSQFTPYEGIISGTEVKSLINKIIASNAVNKDHIVYITGINSMGSLGSFGIRDVNTSKQYDVTLLPGSDGYIYKVNIGSSNNIGCSSN